MKIILKIITSIIIVLIFSSSLIAIDIHNTIDSAIKKSDKNHNNILVIFSIDSCSYCDALKHNILENSKQYENYNISIIDGIEDKEIANKYQIKSWPTSIILSSRKNSVEVGRFVGFSKKKYSDWLEKNSQKGKK